MSLPALVHPVTEQARTATGLQGSNRRPRVAMLSTWHPEPADNGRKQRTRNMIDALADACDVTLISLLPEAGPPEPLPIVPQVGRQFSVRIPASSSSSLRLAMSTLHSYPRSQVTIWNRATADRIAGIVRDVGAQVVIGTDLRTLRYLTYLPAGVVTILDEPDVSWVIDPAETPGGAFGGLRAAARRRKYRRLLRGAASELDGVVVASDLEASAYQALATGSTPVIIENAIAALPHDPWRPPSGGVLLYTGSITYQPNYEAVAFMQQAVLPRLAAADIDAQLVVTGQLPELIPAELRSPHIQFTGVLPDLAAQLRAARVFVCPLRSGTGTRIKLIEAMAYGLPIVATRKACEGLTVEDGVQLLIAEHATGFVAAIRTLLEDDALCLQIGARARELVERRYTRETQGAMLRRLVAQLSNVECSEVAHG